MHSTFNNRGRCLPVTINIILADWIYDYNNTINYIYREDKKLIIMKANLACGLIFKMVLMIGSDRMRKYDRKNEK